MLFLCSQCEKLFLLFTSFLLPLSHTPTAPSLSIFFSFSHGEHFLSGREEAAFFRRRGGTDPEAGGKPPANTPALLKLDSAVNHRPGICIKNLALGSTTDQKLKKSEASVNLFVYYSCNISALQ